MTGKKNAVMAATQIIQVPLERLIPYARNSRTHNDAQVAQIAASIREFGWTNPVLIDGDGGIIAGHGRVLAGRQLGIEQVPCIRLEHLSDAQKRVHPTQKPIALAEWCIDNYAEECVTVLDLFGGSGSTLIACETRRKDCFVMELSAAYCDVIIKRWQDFTGQQATLEATGKTFVKMTDERNGAQG